MFVINAISKKNSPRIKSFNILKSIIHISMHLKPVQASFNCMGWMVNDFSLFKVPKAFQNKAF